MRRMALLFALTPFLLTAQGDTTAFSPRRFSDTGFIFGLGIGQPYGGLGVQLQYRITPVLGVFGGYGTVLAGTSGNAGVVVRLSPQTLFCPFLTGMYGYNAAIYVKGASKYDEIYYGTTFGIGAEFRSRYKSRYFSLQVLLPQRSQEFQEDLEALLSDPRIVPIFLPWPITVALGFLFEMF
jgi:hypothetical protein